MENQSKGEAGLYHRIWPVSGVFSFLSKISEGSNHLKKIQNELAIVIH